jgi:hypothetical protein
VHLVYSHTHISTAILKTHFEVILIIITYRESQN